MGIRTGLDVLAANQFANLKGKIAVICNQASVDHQFRHVLDVLGEAQAERDFRVVAAFGPQHGLAGTTQDNMIEWNGQGAESFRYPVYSLYGEHREPTDEMLSGVEQIVVDLPDVGSRYYTFIWTMSLAMKAAQRLGVPMLVLDRPNPIGSKVEGTVLDPNFASFVGLHPLPLRHGMTIGEIALLFQSQYYPDLVLDVIEIEGWDRNSYADTNGYAWVMPSPNMPTVETAVVYPGGCLLEGTNLSEGRGTTRPFEMIGAPWLNGEKLALALNQSDLRGVFFRPVQFEPTFNKYAGLICNGVFVHVTDRDEFEPVMAYSAIMVEAIIQKGLHDSSHVKTERFVAAGKETNLPGFAWKQPPYEYEYEKLPIDILFGNSWVREAIEQAEGLDVIRQRMAAEIAQFVTPISLLKGLIKESY
ncbi:MAG: DUF1343 domain-containing protein [Armatimonadota bacterium]